MADPIDDYRKRPLRYENIDGTGEMFFGCMYLGFALLGAFETPSFKQHPWPGVLWFYAILLSALGLGWWATRLIKNRITYRRTGYVAYRRDKKRRALTMAAGAAVAAGSLLLLRWGLRHNAGDLIQLGLLSAPAALLALMSREHRWKLWLAALIVLFSVGLVFGGPEMAVLQKIYKLFFGLVFLASGLITLFLYIRRTRPAEQEAE
jgi:peptidoglycan/LPS O-acetylase OafA/YrhL